jgi:hypothetical protein
VDFNDDEILDAYIWSIIAILVCASLSLVSWIEFMIDIINRAALVSVPLFEESPSSIP